MPSLSIRHQLLLGTLFIALLVVTRGHNLFSIDWLPSSTIALFFLIGVFFRQIWVLTLAFVVVWSMDITGLTWSGGSNFCLSNSYAFLLASYAVYWVGGQAFARLYQGQNLRSLATLSVIAPVSAALGYFVSAASFHYLSGKFEPDFAQMFADYAARLPAHLEGLAFYLAVTVVAYTLLNTRNTVSNLQHA